MKQGKNQCAPRLRAYIAKSSFTVNGRSMPKNTIVVYDGDCMYMCVDFPRTYAGENPRLWVSVYDIDARRLDDPQVMQNAVTRKLWKCFVGKGRKRPYYGDTTDYAHEMRSAIRKRKNSSGGVVMYAAKERNDLQERIEYKQITSYAYWENLNNAKSGKASVVASRIR